MDYRTIFISDVHLGSKGCKAEILNNFLKNSNANKLYLIGDIVDGWKIQQNRWAWRQAHSNVVRRILGYAKRGTEVIYVAGNHDEFLRPMIPYGLTFGRIQVVNQYTHVGLDGKKYLVVHGDLFDGITRLAPWISFLGDKSYDALISLNTKLNWWRHKLGFGYWSLSQYLKQRVKRAVDFMFHFERNLTDYGRKRGFDGVICGHIHKAEIKEINGIIYMNDGDWVESCTALVEHLDGRWEIIHWTKTNEDDTHHNRQFT
ncbi:MAG: UDP-2,3-diacylglucosamine diphosphatase [Alphaproteobacteria bacterium]|nr:UDP-2,3-diacylglucosamine diphosphatase [Alphaproteobacteria bacterium]